MFKFLSRASYLSLLLSISSFASNLHVENDDSTSFSSHAIHKTQETIDIIKKLHQEGKKLGLFIGRTDQEALPGEEDLKTFPEDQGIIWVSGDCVYKGMLGRLHVQINFENELETSKLNGLFHKVVIDLSTWKFFSNVEDSDPAARFSKLLTKDPSSTLIFESAFQFIQYSNDISETRYGRYQFFLPTKLVAEYGKKRKIYLQDFLKEIDEKTDQEKHQLIDTYLTEKAYAPSAMARIKKRPLQSILEMIGNNKAESLLKQEENYKCLDGNINQAKVRAHTKSYLETLFTEVILKENTPFYKNDHYAENPTYFIAKGPK